MPAAAFFLLVPFFAFVEGEPAVMPPEKIELPERFDGWGLEGPPRRIDEANIFEYMNGAGELYLSYHFDHLLVYEYAGQNGNTILVELYQMREPRDAFGLLSLDWSGEAVDLGRHVPSQPGKNIIPPDRALYGQGLLRAWSDDMYLRILGSRESPEIRAAILELGKLITTNRQDPAPPEFLQVVNPSNDSPWLVRRDRTAYFYSHLILNSMFYLSHENILDLDSSTEAVMTAFERRGNERENPPVTLLVVRYPDYERAAGALTDFFNAYLPEIDREIKTEESLENRDFFQIEDGWLGYRLVNRHLALAFACPDRESALEILDRAVLP